MVPLPSPPPLPRSFWLTFNTTSLFPQCRTALSTGAALATGPLSAPPDADACAVLSAVGRLLPTLPLASLSMTAVSYDTGSGLATGLLRLVPAVNGSVCGTGGSGGVPASTRGTTCPLGGRPLPRSINISVALTDVLVAPSLLPGASIVPSPELVAPSGLTDDLAALLAALQPFVPQGLADALRPVLSGAPSPSQAAAPSVLVADAAASSSGSASLGVILGAAGGAVALLAAGAAALVVRRRRREAAGLTSKRRKRPILGRSLSPGEALPKSVRISRLSTGAGGLAPLEAKADGGGAAFEVGALASGPAALRYMPPSGAEAPEADLVEVEGSFYEVATGLYVAPAAAAAATARGLVVARGLGGGRLVPVSSAAGASAAVSRVGSLGSASSGNGGLAGPSTIASATAIGAGGATGGGLNPSGPSVHRLQVFQPTRAAMAATMSAADKSVLHSTRRIARVRRRQQFGQVRATGSDGPSDGSLGGGALARFGGGGGDFGALLGATEFANPLGAAAWSSSSGGGGTAGGSWEGNANATGESSAGVSSKFNPLRGIGGSAATSASPLGGGGFYVSPGAPLGSSSSFGAGSDAGSPAAPRRYETFASRRRLAVNAAGGGGGGDGVGASSNPGATLASTRRLVPAGGSAWDSNGGGATSSGGSSRRLAVGDSGAVSSYSNPLRG